MAEINTAAAVKCYIGGTTEIDWSSDSNAKDDFEAETWVELALVEDAGEGGSESEIITKFYLGDSFARKAKGGRDSGNREIICGDDPLDAGQQALIAAEQTNFKYNFKIVVPNNPDATYTPGIEYFRGLVTSRRRTLGVHNNVISRRFSVAIDGKILEVAPAIIP